MKRVFIAAVLLSTVFVAGVLAAPIKSKIVRGAAFQSVTAGMVSVAPIITTGQLEPNSDGSAIQHIVVVFNGATRDRKLFISASGTSLSLDGVAIASLPPAFVNHGAAAVNYISSMNTLLNTAGAQALLSAP